MKSADRVGSAPSVMQHNTMGQTAAAHLSSGVSYISHEAEAAGAKASERPEENAVAGMEQGLGYSALAISGISAPQPRTQDIRNRVVQKEAFRKSDTGHAANTVNGNAAKSPAASSTSNIPDVMDERFYTNCIQNAKDSPRKNRVQRQLFAQRAAAKHAEKEISAKGVEAARKGASARLQHWQHGAKQKIILQHAARQKLSGHAAASGGTHLISAVRLPSPRPFRLPAVRSGLNRTLERALQWVASAIAKAVHVVISSILPLLSAGGVVLLLLMVVGATAAIIGSPMGILFADDTGDPNSIPISSIVQEVNADFVQQISAITAAYPECDEIDIQYAYEAGRTWASFWPEILAVFAVQNNLGADGNVVVIDASNAQKIRDTFWEMHEITSEVEGVEITAETDENESSGSSDETDPEDEDNADSTSTQYRYILHISVKGKSVDELADEHHFTAEQREILRQLLSAEMRSMLQALCGNAAGSGTMQWPLPGFTLVSCQFGEPDAIRGLPHKGTDIPAPEGTPILAAHDGTVMISGWDDSYGNQVVLDDGAGVTTRYAHMTVTAVTVGETVSAGQVIGYVGSTGDSTGNHLHFEVMIDGLLVDPLVQIAA